MPQFDDSIWRIVSTQSVAVTSTAVSSGAKFGTETYAIQVCFATVNSGVAAFVNVGSTLVPANSTGAGAMLPGNWVANYKVTPGQTLAAQCINATAITLYVTELTK